jgi:hypothetical protein
MESAMTHWPSRKILISEIHESLARIFHARCGTDEAVAATQKSINESRLLMEEADVVIARRQTRRKAVAPFRP